MEFTKRDASAVFLGLILGGVITHIAEISSWSGQVDWPKTFESMSHIAQAIGLLVAALWAYYLFVRQRLSRCRINLEHDVRTIKLDGEHLVRVLLEIKNTGFVLVSPSSGIVQLHRVAPATVTQRANVKTTTTTSENNWPEVGKFELDFKKPHLQLEPGERERYAIDFVVTEEITGVQVYSKIYYDVDDSAMYLDLATVHPVPSHPPLKEPIDVGDE